MSIDGKQHLMNASIGQKNTRGSSVPVQMLALATRMGSARNDYLPATSIKPSVQNSPPRTRYAKLAENSAFAFMQLQRQLHLGLLVNGGVHRGSVRAATTKSR
jgi:hypothetical protein